jgi:ribosome biogenesis SPOUT family RNA methylase Rps3
MPARRPDPQYFVRFNPEDKHFEVLIPGGVAGRCLMRGRADKIGEAAWAELQAQKEGASITPAPTAGDHASF